VPGRHLTRVERAENATAWDVEGRQYIDFAGGITALNTGHRHPSVMDAIAPGGLGGTYAGSPIVCAVLLVPLTASDLEVQQGMDIIAACFAELN
jgi:4-aminobutyrate aminotransferase-like enzyme